jgi:hypothetical protein
MRTPDYLTLVESRVVCSHQPSRHQYQGSLSHFLSSTVWVGLCSAWSRHRECGVTQEGYQQGTKLLECSDKPVCGQRGRRNRRYARMKLYIVADHICFGATIRRDRLPDVAKGCINRLSKRISLLRVAHRCCVLRSRWCHEWCQTCPSRVVCPQTVQKQLGQGHRYGTRLRTSGERPSARLGE